MESEDPLVEPELDAVGKEMFCLIHYRMLIIGVRIGNKITLCQIYGA